ncbi:MAG: orotate phosphoribosyltransferase [Marvinbryantia sp.]|jgi:orotate phosphoribosyltransferase
MESRVIRIPSKVNANVVLRVIPGHFATTHSHINHYVDMTFLKARKSEAEGAAKILAQSYGMTTYIDTIVCMDGCEIIGAYLADELTRNGIMSLNSHKTMYVVSPEIHTGGQLIFRDNMQNMIKDKHVLLVLATASTGITVKRAVECIRYYGGIMEGAAALFSATDEVEGIKIHSLFTAEDIPEYETYHFTECPMCRRNEKLDAIVNSYGYSRM